MEKRFFDHDPLTGLTEWFHYDPFTGDVVIETQQDVGDILDSNKQYSNDTDFSNKGIKEGMWKYASIPLVIQLRWLNEYGRENWPMRPGNEKLLFKLLNSPEWKYLKTTEKVHTARS